MTDPVPIPDANAHLVDTHGFGLDQYCGVFVLEDAGEVALIETGPSTTTAAVLAGLERLGHAPADVTHVLATHVHLDHCGATWQLLDACPNATATLHEKGAPFLTDAGNVAKLLHSVERAVGEDRFPMYGTFEAIDPDRVNVVKGAGETVSVGDRTLGLHDAPGHAPHQFVVHEKDTGVVYAGDAAGIRTPGGPILLTSPPPRFDHDAWMRTFEMLRSLEPTWLALTHFGWVDASHHLDQYETILDAAVDQVRRHRDAGLDLEATIAEVMPTYERARAVYDDRTYAFEVRMNTTGIWLYLERGA